MPKFTTEDLLLFLYDEMSAERKREMEAILQTDWALAQKYQVLKEAHDRLKSIKLASPRSKTIAAIMQYAEESIHQHK
jgi:anti-sigma factor RsiW